MFNLLASFAKINYEWKDIDLSNNTLEEILAYQEGRFTVDWDGLFARDFFVSVNSAAMRRADKELTLTEWLSTLEEGDLITTDRAAGLIDSNAVQCYDLYDVAEEVKKGNINYGVGVAIPPGLESDIIFSTSFSAPDYRQTENYSKQILAVVNGLIHPTIYQQGYIHILGAYERFLSEKDQLINLIDFSGLGGIETYEITDSMIHEVERTMTDQNRYVTRMVVTLPEDIGLYTPLLVLDGHLHVIDDDTYEIIDRDKLLIEVDHYLALQRAALKPRNTRTWVDPANLQKIGINTLSFNARKYLSDTYSFVVLVKTADLAIMREPLGSCKVQNTYYHYRAPKGIVYFDDMTMANARVTDYNENEVEISTMSNERPIWTYETTPVTDLIGYSENGYPTPTPKYKDGYVLELYSFA